MNYFDLHCDTITAKADGKNETSVSLSKVKDFESYTQCHAIFVDDSYGAKSAFEKAKQYLMYYKENQSEFENENCRSILTLENGLCLGDDLNNIRFWAENKVKVCGLTWNGKNMLGFGAGYYDYDGLTDFGIEAVKELERNNIIVDVSHLNYKGFFDVAKVSEKPFIATHSNCYCICNNNRNLKDEQIKEIVNHGGLIGICFYPLFLGKGNIFELIFEHIYKILDMGGENSVCFGSDFDGAKMDKSLDGIDKVKDLFCYFQFKGIYSALLDKIFFKNAENFFNKCFT